MISSDRAPPAEANNNHDHDHDDSLAADVQEVQAAHLELVRLGVERGWIDEVGLDTSLARALAAAGDKDTKTGVALADRPRQLEAAFDGCAVAGGSLATTVNPLSTRTGDGVALSGSSTSTPPTPNHDHRARGSGMPYRRQLQRVAGTLLADSLVFLVVAFLLLLALHGTAALVAGIPDIRSHIAAQEGSDQAIGGKVAGPIWWQITRLRLGLYVLVVCSVAGVLVWSKSKDPSASERVRCGCCGGGSYEVSDNNDDDDIEQKGRDTRGSGEPNTRHHPKSSRLHDLAQQGIRRVTLASFGLVAAAILLVVIVAVVPEEVGRSNTTTVDMPISRGGCIRSSTLTVEGISLAEKGLCSWFLSKQATAVTNPFVTQAALPSGATNTTTSTDDPGGCRQLSSDDDKLWASPSAAVRLLDEWNDAISSGLMKAQFDHASSHSGSVLFGSSECSQWLVEAACAASIRVCRLEDCSPVNIDCTRDALHQLMACRNISKADLGSALRSFRDDYFGLQQAKPFVSASSYCAARTWFDLKIEASNTVPESMSAVSSCANATIMASSKDKVASLPTSCNPQTAMYTVESTTTTKPNDIREPLATAVLAAAAGCGILALATTGSTVSMANMAWQSRRRTGLKRRLLLWVLGVAISLINFAGGLLSELVPDGIKPKGGCGSEAATSSTASAEPSSSLFTAPFSWWAVFYYTIYFVGSSYAMIILVGFFGADQDKDPSQDITAPASSATLPRLIKRCPWIGLVMRAKTFYDENLGLQQGQHVGRYFLTKMLVVEFLSSCYQFGSALATSGSQESNVVLTTYAIIGANLCVLPIVITLATRFLALPEATLLICLVKILFDKALVVALLFVRSPTTEALQNKALYHSSPLFAAALAVDEIDTIGNLITAGIKDLTKRGLKAKTAPVPAQSSSDGAADDTGSTESAHDDGPSRQQNNQCRGIPVAAVCLWIVAALVSICCGLLLIAVPVAQVASCDAMWTSILGAAEACAVPRLYFADSNCGLSRVTALECGATANNSATGRSSRQRAAVSGRLPNAPEYADFTNLCRIDMSGQQKLIGIPANWKLLQSLVRLDLSGTSVDNIPVELCSRHESRIGRGSSSNASFEMTLSADVPAARKLVWNGRDLISPLTSVGDNNILRGCVDAVKGTLMSLDVSDNLVNTGAGLLSLDVFEQLEQLDIARNNISGLLVSGDLYDKPSERWRLPVFFDYTRDSTIDEADERAFLSHLRRNNLAPDSLIESIVRLAKAVTNRTTAMPKIPFRHIMRRSTTTTGSLPSSAAASACPIKGLLSANPVASLVFGLNTLGSSQAETDNWMACLPPSLEVFSISGALKLDQGSLRKADFGSMTKLRVFTIFNSVTLETAPAGLFDGMPSGPLEWLSFSGCLSLKYFPMGPGVGSVRYLGLDRTNVRTLNDTTFGGYEALEGLHLWPEPIEGRKAVISSSAFQPLRNLRSLFLVSLGTVSMPLDTFATLQNLTHLALRDASFNNRTMLEDMQLPRQLKVLDLMYTNIVLNFSRVSLPPALQEFIFYQGHRNSGDTTGDIAATHWPPALTKIILPHSSAFGNISMVQWPPSLKVLNLDHTYVTGSIEGTQWPSNLTCLWLRNASITGDLSQATFPSKLRSLDLGGTSTSANVSQTFPWPPFLSALYLHDNLNIIGNLETAVFPPSLYHLNLASTAVTGRIEGAQWPSNLTHLWLANTRITGNISQATFPSTITLLDLVPWSVVLVMKFHYD